MLNWKVKAYSSPKYGCHRSVHLLYLLARASIQVILNHRLIPTAYWSEGSLQSRIGFPAVIIFRYHPCAITK